MLCVSLGEPTAGRAGSRARGGAGAVRGETMADIRVRAAEVVEPARSSVAETEDRDSTGVCRNCGAPAAHDFCSACGQSTDIRIPTLFGVISDVLDGFFNLDSRIWRTLAPLVVSPGRLTLEYFAGRRARYVPPFRLYLVLSLVYFVVASFTGEDSDPGLSFTPDADEPPAVVQQCGWVGNIVPGAGGLLDRSVSACENAFQDGGRTLLREFSDRIPLMIFVMIPLFAVGLKLLYLFTGRKLVEHLFFLFHVHAFVFVIATVGAVVTGVNRAIAPGSGIPVLLMLPLWLYVPYYGFRALRNVYGQGRLLTSIKYSMLVLGYFVLMGLTFLAGLIYTAYTL